VVHNDFRIILFRHIHTTTTFWYYYTFLVYHSFLHFLFNMFRVLPPSSGMSEEMAMESATYKPLCWFRYVDDTFVIWPHGSGKLVEFLDHLNGLHENIKFTMETEKDGHLPFLDNDIYRKPDGSLGHRVYRKPTHTNLYLHANSHHHPSNK
jgi:hypothetical protein